MQAAYSHEAYVGIKGRTSFTYGYLFHRFVVIPSFQRFDVLFFSSVQYNRNMTFKYEINIFRSPKVICYSITETSVGDLDKPKLAVYPYSRFIPQPPNKNDITFNMTSFLLATPSPLLLFYNSAFECSPMSLV